ncbi:MAG TPA: recombination mediator RecR [Bdellovibrionales bacterium]|nr:recombination mediator RecR [Bdellovibrionales bacterium]
MFKISSLEKLIHELNRLPGVGPKTAQRLAYFVLRTPDFSDSLTEALELVKNNVRLCSKCFSYTDEPEHCRYCKDTNRRDDVICVVEEPSDIMRLESSGAFRGRYHVLHGAISPLDGIGPHDLKIQELMERVSEGQTKEVILALDPDLEGDTTVLYLAKALSEKQVKVTRIASGVPLGSDIDYIDDRTLGRALENRIEL